ncbi:RBM33 isoform 11, partial [Pan troglodytes]
CKPQPCVVSVEGLSSSTTDAQLKSLLMSVGPIQSLQMLPQQRKAIAKFKEPAHALAFQQKFHRELPAGAEPPGAQVSPGRSPA